MSRTKRTVSRVAGVALALTGAAAFMAAGQASANDRAVVVSCTDQSTGTWTVSVTFSAIEVREDRPVQVNLGSESATLTEPGPERHRDALGVLRLRQEPCHLDLVGGPLDYQNMGKLEPRPAGRVRAGDDRGAAVERGPPVVRGAALQRGAHHRAGHGPQLQATPAPSVQASAVPARDRSPDRALLALGTGAVLGGIGLVAAARRRPEQA